MKSMCLDDIRMVNRLVLSDLPSAEGNYANDRLDAVSRVLTGLEGELTEMTQLMLKAHHAVLSAPTVQERIEPGVIYFTAQATAAQIVAECGSCRIELAKIRDYCFERAKGVGRNEHA